MRLIVAVTLLLSLPAWADQSIIENGNAVIPKWNCGNTSTCGDWITKYKYGGGTIELHWTHVYEGEDTVFRIDFPQRKDEPSSLKVEGQPIFNTAKTFVALPYCADDGCQNEVAVVDLVNRKKLVPIKLPYDMQIYIAGDWRDNLLILKVDADKGVVEHLFEVSSSGVVEQTKSNPTLKRDALKRAP